MDRLQTMRAFVRVAETGGFGTAARDLRMSSPAVTRAVADLEMTIGTRLFVRTTRSVKLTESGRNYFEDCKRILSDIDEAEAAAAGSYIKPTGTLTVTSPVQFGRLYILPIILEYLDLHPSTVVRTLFVDRVVNILEEEADVAVRIGRLPDSSLSAIRVGDVRRVVCASPQYLKKRGMPERPEDIRNHSIIGLDNALGSRQWRFRNDKRRTIETRPRLICNTIDGALAAALDGRGLIRLLSYQVAPSIKKGQLEAVLEKYEQEPMPIHIVNPEGRRASAKVRAFIDLAAERLKSNPMIK